jgi:hypothetical protein
VRTAKLRVAALQVRPKSSARCTTLGMLVNSTVAGFYRGERSRCRRTAGGCHVGNLSSLLALFRVRLKPITSPPRRTPSRLLRLLVRLAPVRVEQGRIKGLAVSEWVIWTRLTVGSCPACRVDGEGVVTTQRYQPASAPPRSRGRRTGAPREHLAHWRGPTSVTHRRVLWHRRISE